MPSVGANWNLESMYPSMNRDSASTCSAFVVAILHWTVSEPLRKLCADHLDQQSS